MANIVHLLMVKYTKMDNATSTET